ncbi:hypothetical protein AAG906_031260 [Vitis piasezkii]
MDTNEDSPHIRAQLEDEGSVLNSNLFLEHVGEEKDGLSCLGIKFISKSETEIKFSDVYAVEFINWGLIHESVLSTAGGCLIRHESEMYRFTVHGVQRSKTRPSLLVLAVYTFGHKDLQMCHMWVNRINALLKMETGRPKSLLVCFVHPLSGKGSGCRTWQTVAPIFSHAKVKTKVIVTQRAGHAFDVMASISNEELNSHDGVIAVGGDGFFNEILNGLLSSRLKAPYPPAPADFVHSVGSNDSVPVHDPNETDVETSCENEDHSPLLSSPRSNPIELSNLRSCDRDQDSKFSLPNERFRFGIIPAGSTDAIVICSTGTRDPVTSALHIVLGKRVCLDIAQVVRWKTTSTSKDVPCVRYAASFMFSFSDMICSILYRYGFYGDVITESEKYRWMGPKRYDYAGTKVFLRHRSYEAEVACLEVKSEKTSASSETVASRRYGLWLLPKNLKEWFAVLIAVLATQIEAVCLLVTKMVEIQRSFLSVGAAIISCRNERAPDGLVADAHLSDGFLHLILIKTAPCILFMLARRGGNPLNFEFVEHYKTTAFTFTSSSDDSVWNLDGEPFQAHKLSAQVFRGLVNLFASGPEV